MDEILKQILVKLESLESGQTGLRQEMTDMHQEVTDLRQEMTVTHQEVTDLRQEMTVTHQEVTDLRQEMHERFDTLETKLDTVRSQTAYNTEQELRLKAAETDIALIKKAITNQ